MLEVEDTGIGIPAEEQDRLFTRFFRASTAQDRAIPGSGLGLSIAGAIVDSHGGRIEVASGDGCRHDDPGPPAARLSRGPTRTPRPRGISKIQLLLSGSRRKHARHHR